MTLLELADRVEAATGPDRELDAAIWLAVTPGATRKQTVIPANGQRQGWTIDETREATGRLIIVPHYTASLDAAMTLVPEGRFVGALNQCDPGGEWHARIECHHAVYEDATAKTAATALLAAALRARANVSEQEE